MRPIMNLDEAAFDDVEENGRYTSRRATIGRLIGARQLGYNLTEVPPGKMHAPFHSHHAAEEMFFVLEGEGELRFGAERFPLRARDVIACPVGGAAVAHQIINTGSVTLRYLAVSTVADVDVYEYPDSGKLATATREGRTVFRRGDEVGYYEGEPA